MKITIEEVEHVAHLARLNIKKQELEKMTEQLDSLLSYVAKLDNLNTENITPTTHAFAIENAFRQDIIEDSLSQNLALDNAPKQNGEYFIVPKIL
jgi:aspartyl-tRNA(Asn)/glutamyl-tRNA(Gln) amidotransferase subunit C